MNGIRWVPAAVWMIVIFVLSHQPGETLDSYMPLFQRWFPWLTSFNSGHLIAYFILALLVYYGFGYRFAHVRGRGIVILVCIIYGITDEFHQTFVPGRTAEGLDVVNDAIGATLAMLLVSIPRVHTVISRLPGFGPRVDRAP